MWTDPITSKFMKNSLLHSFKPQYDTFTHRKQRKKYGSGKI
jgi:hypothetical protein